MDGLSQLADSSVHCCVTSPPFWGLRNYGFDGQIGSEKTPAEFVSAMVNVFTEVRRVIRDDGVLFLNLGDTYATGAGSARNPGSRVYGKSQPHYESGAIPVYQANRMNFGLGAGNLCGVPWMVALALQANGWTLRKDIIWSKPSPMPESVSGWRWVKCRRKVGTVGKSKQTIENQYPEDSPHRNGKGGSGSSRVAVWESCAGCERCEKTDGMILRRGSWRPTTAHEYVFMFSKTSSYFCDGHTSKEPTAGTAHSRGTGINPKCNNGTAGIERQNGSFSSVVTETVETRNLRSVWRISSESYSGADAICCPSGTV